MPRPQNLPTRFLVFAAALAAFVGGVTLVDHGSRRSTDERSRAGTDEAGLEQAMSFVSLSGARP